MKRTSKRKPEKVRGQNDPAPSSRESNHPERNPVPAPPPAPQPERSEAVAIGERLKPMEKHAASQRRKETEGRPAKTGRNLRPVSESPKEPKTSEKVAAAVGMKPRTYAKAAVVVAAAEPLGLECSRCGCRHFFLLGTRPGTGGKVRRRRACRHCGQQITTSEVES